MYDILFNKIDELVSLLAARKSASVYFFENTKRNLQTDPENIDELNSLIKCFAITQYANFSKKEEDILNQVIDLARNIRDQITPLS
jgi:hypothetical protein